MTVSLNVAYTTVKRAGASGKLSAKFWVMNAELGGTGELSSQRVDTQQLTVKLKPRIEVLSYDAQGRVQQVATRDLDVSGHLEQGEEFAAPPPSPSGE